MSLTTRTPISRCGKPYSTEDEALNSKRGRSGNYLTWPHDAHWHLRRKPVSAGVTRKPSADTGFSAEVKLLIRTRAGNGDPERAMCEACGILLGLDGGQIQHIYARQMGGSKAWLYRSAANGALLCGTRYTGDHGLCEDRDPHMHEAGFWRERNGKEKPGDYPIMLHGKGGGRLAWLTPDGQYTSRAPERGFA